MQEYTSFLRGLQSGRDGSIRSVKKSEVDCIYNKRAFAQEACYIHVRIRMTERNERTKDNFLTEGVPASRYRKLNPLSLWHVGGL